MLICTLVSPCYRSKTFSHWIKGKYTVFSASDEKPLQIGNAAAKPLQSCPTLCDPRDGCPPGSPVPGILQVRTLEWVAISFSSAWKWKVKVKSLSRVLLLVTPWTAAYQAPPFMGFSRQEYWSGVPLPSPVRLLKSLFQQLNYAIYFLLAYAIYNFS